MSESIRNYFDPTTAEWGVLKHDATGEVTSWEPRGEYNTACIRSIASTRDSAGVTEFVSAAGLFSGSSWRVAKVVGEATTDRVRDLELGPVTEEVLDGLRVDGSAISDLAHAVVWCDIMGAVDRAVASTV
jgi:hypothetical protein